MECYGQEINIFSQGMAKEYPFKEAYELKYKI
jgi:hypothetical protein